MIKKNRKYFNWINRILDLILIYISYILTIWFWLFFMKSDAGNIAIYFAFENPLPILLLSFIYLTVFQYGGMYDSFKFHSLFDELIQLLKIYLPCIGLAIACIFLFRVKDFSRGVIICFGIISYLLLAIKRIISYYSLRQLRKKDYNKKQVVIVGCGNLATKYLQNILSNPNYGFHVIGYLGKENSKLNCKYLGLYSDLANIISFDNPDEIIIALQDNEMSQMHSILLTCEEQGIRTFIMPIYNDYLPDCASIDVIGNIKLINIREIPLDIYFNRIVKRFFDIILSIIAIILLSPIMLITTIAVKLSSPGPIFFRQIRVGKDRKEFEMLKFRSMVQNNTSNTAWSTNKDSRVTKVGAFIRKCSIDELPQFFNVLKGDMSIIGPRPELPYFVKQYMYTVPKYMVKHQVKPGITGWAQVNGYRGDTSIEKRIEYDIWYIENWSIFLDIKILFMTVFGGMINNEKNLSK